MDTPLQKDKNQKFSRLLSVLLAVLLFAVSASLAFLVRYYTQDSAARTLRWVRTAVKNSYYREIPEETLNSATLDDFFGYNGKTPLLDEYSAYYTAEEYKIVRTQQAGGQSGVGVSFVSDDQGDSKIYRVSGNSPAEASGLRAGMYLLGFGSDENNLIYSTKSSQFGAFIADIPTGQTFTLLAAENKEDEGSFYTVCKAVYEQNYVFYADNALSYRFTGEKADVLTEGEDRLCYLPADTACIRLDSFSGDAAEQFSKILQVFSSRGKNRLILDLRNNGGGQMNILCDIAAYLCKDAKNGKFPVSVARYKKDRNEAYYANKNRYGEYFSDNSEIYILANENTASASEALMGAMLDYGTIEYSDIFLAELGGVAKSYGKGIMQTTYGNILTGEAVKLTTATVHWPVSDVCIQGKGVLPADNAVAVPAAGYADFADTMLRTVVANYLA